MADDRDALAVIQAAASSNWSSVRYPTSTSRAWERQVVDELGHPDPVLGGDAELGEPALAAERVEGSDRERVARRQLAEGDRAVEPGEALVEDRHGLALAEDALAPEHVGAHPDAALADDRRACRGRHRHGGHDARHGREEPLHGGPSNQTLRGASSPPGRAECQLATRASANWQHGHPHPGLS